jgi:hypothetical protein
MHLLTEETEFVLVITQSDSFDALEQLIVELNAKYQTQGKYENIIHQLSMIDKLVNAKGIQLVLPILCIRRFFQKPAAVHTGIIFINGAKQIIKPWVSHDVSALLALHAS